MDLELSYTKSHLTKGVEYETILEHTSNKAKGLTEAGRLCYERLREWRKQTAEKEGITPPFFVIPKTAICLKSFKKKSKHSKA